MLDYITKVGELIENNQGKIAFLGIIMTGVPTAAGFYTPILGDKIPVVAITRWVPRFGAVTIAFIVGYYVSQVSLRSNDDKRKLVGYIENNDVIWKGYGKGTEGRVKDVKIENLPLCPKCRTEMKSREQVVGKRDGPMVRSQKLSYWRCPHPNCGFEATREGDDDKDARKILKRHFKNIIESEGKDYSLNNLSENYIDLSAEELWERYRENHDDLNLAQTNLS